MTVSANCQANRTQLALPSASTILEVAEHLLHIIQCLQPLRPAGSNKQQLDLFNLFLPLLTYVSRI